MVYVGFRKKALRYVSGISRSGNLLMLARAVNPCLLPRNFHRIRPFHAERTYEDPRWPGWEVVVGLEVHAQLKTRQKLFSGQRTILNEGCLLIFVRTESLTSELGHVANTHVYPYDAAFPGTLPVKTSSHVPAKHIDP
jgi:aspartyl-tRNA(Asn)/glutamyl-tRNA(Gln) amidotransferase subunit B